MKKSVWHRALKRKGVGVGLCALLLLGCGGGGKNAISPMENEGQGGVKLRSSDSICNGFVSPGLEGKYYKDKAPPSWSMHAPPKHVENLYYPN